MKNVIQTWLDNGEYYHSSWRPIAFKFHMKVRLTVVYNWWFLKIYQKIFTPVFNWCFNCPVLQSSPVLNEISEYVDVSSKASASWQQSQRNWTRKNDPDIQNFENLETDLESRESLGTLGSISAPVRRLTDSISYSNQITNLLPRSNSIRVAGLSAQPTSPNWFVHFVNWFIFNRLNEWIETTSAIQVVADEPAMGYVEWKKVKISIGWPDLKHFLFAKRTSSGDFVCC